MSVDPSTAYEAPALEDFGEPREISLSRAEEASRPVIDALVAERVATNVVGPGRRTNTGA